MNIEAFDDFLWALDNGHKITRRRTGQRGTSRRVMHSLELKYLPNETQHCPSVKAENALPSLTIILRAAKSLDVTTSLAADPAELSSADSNRRSGMESAVLIAPRCASPVIGSATSGRIYKERIMVTAMTGLVEDWITMRAMLLKQVKMLETGNPISGSNETGSATNATVARLKACIAELNVLLKEHARDSRTITATS